MITQSEWELIPLSDWIVRRTEPGSQWLIGNMIQRTGREPEVYVKLATRPESTEPKMNLVWVYYDTNKQMGDEGHLVIFASGEAADEWLAIHDPEGVFWSYPVVR